MDPSLSNVLTSAEVQAFASGFPVMVMHLVVTLLLLAAGATVYALMTPWKEVALIRDGNPAAPSAPVPSRISRSMSLRAVHSAEKRAKHFRYSTSRRM